MTAEPYFGVSGRGEYQRVLGDRPISDFQIRLAAERSGCTLPPEVVSTNALLLSPKQLEKSFGNDHSGGWRRFRRQYPDAVGVVDVSGVGLSEDGQRAFVSFGLLRGLLYGYGVVAELARTGDTWKVVWQHPSWEA